MLVESIELFSGTQQETQEQKIQKAKALGKFQFLYFQRLHLPASERNNINNELIRSFQDCTKAGLCKKDVVDHIKKEQDLKLIRE